MWGWGCISLRNQQLLTKTNCFDQIMFSSWFMSFIFSFIPFSFDIRIISQIPPPLLFSSTGYYCLLSDIQKYFTSPYSHKLLMLHCALSHLAVALLSDLTLTSHTSLIAPTSQGGGGRHCSWLSSWEGCDQKGVTFSIKTNSPSF